MPYLRLWAWVILTLFVAAPASACVLNATRVVGLAVWQPEAGVDDYRSLTYFPETGEWGLTRAEFSGEPWSRQNIQNAAGTIMSRAWAGSGALNTPWIAPRAGLITGVSVCAETHIGTGTGKSYTVEVRQTGVATGISATIPPGAYKAYYTAAPSQCVPFAAGDEISLHDTKTGAVCSVGATAQWFGVWTE